VHGLIGCRSICGQAVRTGSGQVAQVVERSPEKAGVGGSTPSLATIIPKDLRHSAEKAFSPGSAQHLGYLVQFTAVLPDFKMASSISP
jgi:hypothetical protein